MGNTLNKTKAGILTVLKGIGHIFIYIFTPAPKLSMQQENERKANAIISKALIFISLLYFVIYFFLIFGGFFDVTEDAITVFKVAVPVIIVLLLVPSIYVLFRGVASPIYKYIVLTALLLAIGLAYIITSRHTVLAWCIPLVLVMHYYNPRTSRMFFVLSLLFMLITTVLAMVFGEWDFNLMHGFSMSPTNDTIYARWLYITKDFGDGIPKLWSALLQYTLPNMLIIVALYISCRALAIRTFELSNDMASTAAAAERLEGEFKIGSEIQETSLPRNFPNDKRLDVYATMSAAKMVGGDFYDFFYIDNNRFLFCIADCSGKGVPAAMMMMKAKTLIESMVHVKGDLLEDMQYVNKQICLNNDTYMFVTLWVGVINIDDGTVEYVNAGHNYPLIKRKDGSSEYLKNKPNCFLGAKEDIEFEVNKVSLEEGDQLILYTDGVTEALNRKGKFYGDKHLLDVVSSLPNTSSQETVTRIKESVDEFAHGEEQADDLTVFAIKYNKKNTGEDFVVTSEINNIEKVIDFVNAELKKRNADPKVIGQMDVAIDEIFSNIVKFAYSPNIGDVCISTKLKDNMFELSFIDNGKQFNPLLQDDPKLKSYKKLDKVGGLGIFITKNTMDNVTYEYKNNHNILTLYKTIK